MLPIEIGSYECPRSQAIYLGLVGNNLTLLPGKIKENFLNHFLKNRLGIHTKHGVHVERWLVTEDIEGDGIEKPDEIVVTWFENASAKDAFENDPEYKKVAEIRDRAVRLVTITAKSVFGD